MYLNEAEVGLISKPKVASEVGLSPPPARVLLWPSPEYEATPPKELFLWTSAKGGAGGGGRAEGTEHAAQDMDDQGDEGGRKGEVETRRVEAGVERGREGDGKEGGRQGVGEGRGTTGGVVHGGQWVRCQGAPLGGVAGVLDSPFQGLRLKFVRWETVQAMSRREPDYHHWLAAQRQLQDSEAWGEAAGICSSRHAPKREQCRQSSWPTRASRIGFMPHANETSADRGEGLLVPGADYKTEKKRTLEQVGSVQHERASYLRGRQTSGLDGDCVSSLRKNPCSRGDGYREQMPTRGADAPGLEDEDVRAGVDDVGRNQAGKGECEAATEGSALVWIRGLVDCQKSCLDSRRIRGRAEADGEAQGQEIALGCARSRLAYELAAEEQRDWDSAHLLETRLLNCVERFYRDEAPAGTP